VVLDCGTLGRSAVVRWQTGDALGLCFDSELEVREVDALIARSFRSRKVDEDAGIVSHLMSAFDPFLPSAFDPFLPLARLRAPLWPDTVAAETVMLLPPSHRGPLV